MNNDYLLNKIEIVIFCLFLGHSITQAQHKKLETSSVYFEDTGKSIIAKINDKPVFQYNYGNQKPEGLEYNYYQRSGFIHPIYTPEGAILTEAFPKEHTHHHGMFNAWVNTRFKNGKVDFWNQQDQKGTVIFKDIIAVRTTNKYGELITKQQHLAFIGGDTIPVLEELWSIKVYNSNEPYVWDISIEQRNISHSNLEVLKYHYGGLAFRARDEWNLSEETRKAEDFENGAKAFRIVTNDKKGRIDANHTVPKWINMSGQIDDLDVSLTVVPLSKNPEYPDYVRVHPNLPYFCFTPIFQKGFTLKPTQTFKTKYRLISTNKVVNDQFVDEINKLYPH